MKETESSNLNKRLEWKTKCEKGEAERREISKRVDKITSHSVDQFDNMKTLNSAIRVDSFEKHFNFLTHLIL